MYIAHESCWNEVNFRKLGQLDYSITRGSYFIRFILNSKRTLTILSATYRYQKGRNIYSYPFFSYFTSFLSKKVNALSHLLGFQDIHFVSRSTKYQGPVPRPSIFQPLLSLVITANRVSCPSGLLNTGSSHFI